MSISYGSTGPTPQGYKVHDVTLGKKCNYCGSYYSSALFKCPNCGAPEETQIKHLRRFK